MYQLRRVLGDAARWVVAAIWTFAAELDGSGNLGGYEPEALADAINYEGDPKQLIAALKDSGYIDGSGQILGWDELFGLPASRERAARKGARARWHPTAAASDSEEEKDENRQERGDGDAMRDALRHASPSLSPSSHEAEFKNDLNPTANEFGMTPEATREAWRIFSEIKANYPLDAITPEAFRGWLRSSRPGKDFVAAHILRPEKNTTPEAYDEPDGWRAAAETCEGMEWAAKRDWITLPAQIQRRLVAKVSARES